MHLHQQSSSRWRRRQRCRPLLKLMVRFRSRVAYRISSACASICRRFAISSFRRNTQVGLAWLLPVCVNHTKTSIRNAADACTSIIAIQAASNNRHSPSRTNELKCSCTSSHQHRQTERQCTCEIRGARERNSWPRTFINWGYPLASIYCTITPYSFVQSPCNSDGECR